MNLPTGNADYRTTCPALTRPDDFHRFWDQTLGELAGVEMACQEIHSNRYSPALTEQWFTFESLGWVPITAYSLFWHDDQVRPLVIYTHGYEGQCEVMLDWARRGLNVVGLDLRGMGRSKSAALTLSPHGYVLSGIESEQTSILRGVVCDFIRATDIALHHMPGKLSRLIFHGHSFGGAISLMAAALTRRPDLLVSGVPTLGWAEGRRQMVKQGSGLEINRYLQQHPQQEQGIMQTLAYFDSMNFADMLDCPSLIGVGAEDLIVPAATVYAITNHIRCPLEIRELPVSHSDHPQEQLWQRFEAEWLQLADGGIPEGFGHTGRQFRRIV